MCELGNFSYHHPIHDKPAQTDAIMYSILLTFVALTAACTDDTSCNLNGLCISGSCKCDPGWTSDDCSMMNLLPSVMSSCGPACAYTGLDSQSHTWGGSVIKEGSTYYMYAAHFADHSDLSAWRTKSEVTVATSSTPMGPYEPKGVVIPIWSHNPEVIKAPDGTFVIFIIGTGQKPSVGEDKNDGTAQYVVFASKDPLGPFTPHTINVTGFSIHDRPYANTNPAPMVTPDGKIQVMIHTVSSPWGGEVIIQADTWQGPYKVIVPDANVTDVPDKEEDPFMWVDTRGHYHVLYHLMFDPPGGALGYWVGGHSSSVDGTNWSNITHAFNTTVHLQNGSTVVFARRERPKLIFNDLGVPTHLLNGCGGPVLDGRKLGDSSFCYTCIQPLAA